MQVTFFPNDKKYQNAIFILGGFETIHKGHLALLNKAKEIAQKDQEIVFCMLYNPQDLPNNNSKAALQFEVRLQMLAEIGIQEVFVFIFSEEFRKLSATNFINILQEQGASAFVVGKDYRFGQNALGDGHLLKKIAPNSFIVDFVLDNEEKVSSSVIKQNIILGNISKINDLLIMPYALMIKNANNLDSVLFPFKNEPLGSGVYITNILNNDIEYHGICHINIHKLITCKVLDNDFIAFATNQNFYIEFLQKIRTIISSAKDSINEDDINIFKEQYKE